MFAIITIPFCCRLLLIVEIPSYPTFLIIKGGNMPEFEDQMELFNIYFSDLTPKTQQRLCKAWGTTPEEENWDIDLAPLAVLKREG